jgi:hypothetical protein
MMIENLLYVIMGFVVAYTSLELVWHFTACRIKEDNNDKKKKKNKAMYIQEIKTILLAALRPPMQII